MGFGCPGWARGGKGLAVASGRGWGGVGCVLTRCRVRRPVLTPRRSQIERRGTVVDGPATGGVRAADLRCQSKNDIGSQAPIGI